jgi:hypothetical protein
VSLIGFSQTIQALIDSGATLNFIHEALVSNLGLPVQPCPPVKVRLADGRTLTHSDRQVTLNFTIAGVPHTQTFLVAPIGIHSMIFGMPWLETVNPLVDWRLKTVMLRPSTSQPPTMLTPAPQIRENDAATKPTRKKSRRSRPRKPRTPNTNEPSSPPQVRLTRRINSNDQVYLLYLDAVDSEPELYSLPEYLSAAQEVAENTTPEIPEQYRDLAEVFSKANSETLPPHRDSLDHAIPLEPDSKPVFGPIYNLSETELQVLREYIDSNLRRGFIRPSTSPFGSLLEIVVRHNEFKATNIHCLSSPNRWPNRTHEPNSRTIPSHVLQSPARQLG